MLRYAPRAWLNRLLSGTTIFLAALPALVALTVATRCAGLGAQSAAALGVITVYAAATLVAVWLITQADYRQPGKVSAARAWARVGFGAGLLLRVIDLTVPALEVGRARMLELMVVLLLQYLWAMGYWGLVTTVGELAWRASNERLSRHTRMAAPVLALLQGAAATLVVGRLLLYYVNQEAFAEMNATNPRTFQTVGSLFVIVTTVWTYVIVVRLRASAMQQWALGAE